MAAGMLGNRKSTQTQQSQSQNHQTSSTDMWNTQNNYNVNRPVWDETSWQARNNLYNQAQGRLNQPLTDPTAWARSQVNQNIWNIGGAAGLQQKLMQQNLASKGINYSAMGDAPRQAMDAGRIQQLIQARNQLPLLQRQAEMENEQIAQSRLGQYMQLYGMDPKGSESEQSSTGHQLGYNESRGTQQNWGTQTDPGNIWGGGIQGFGQGLATVFGSRAGGQSTGSPSKFSNMAFNPYNNRSINPWLNPNYGMSGWGNGEDY